MAEQAKRTFGLGKLWDIKQKLNKIDSTPFLYYCSICLIIRDENEYLKEWLDWHISLGVQHFYIYDHGSKQPVYEYISRLSGEYVDKVTVIDWCGTHLNAQPDAYNDCLKRFLNESRWIGFIDVDEQVRIKNGLTLPEFLQGYERFAGVFAVWLTYGANGHKNKFNEPLRQRFTSLCPPNGLAEYMGKVFVQPMLMKDMHIHNGHPIEDFNVVGEYKDKFEENNIWKANATTELICVDHYYTKSYEEWLEKLNRGSVDADYVRKYDDFFECNPDMEYCREKLYPVQEYSVSKKYV